MSAGDGFSYPEAVKITVVGNSFVAGLMALSFHGCVPKTQFEDQKTKLQEIEEKLRTAESDASKCDPNLYLQFKEQAQSLDVLMQELVDRNTELSKEVARLKALEGAQKGEESACDLRIKELERAANGKLDRTRATYEDLLREHKREQEKLAAKVQELTQKLEDARKPAKKPAPKSEKK